MTMEFNGKTITTNKFIGAFLMSIAIMVFSFIANGVMIVIGEAMSYVAPQWFEPGLLWPLFTQMWIGGVLSLMGVIVVFGRKGSSVGLNQPPRHEIDELRIKTIEEAKYSLLHFKHTHNNEKHIDYALDQLESLINPEKRLKE